MRFVIAGGGVAGITASMDLARRGLGDVVVYSDEEYPYYYRPQLTEFLAGNLTMSRLLRRPLSWYEERGIQLKLGRSVTSVDKERHVVTVGDSDEVSYDKLLLAMGSLPWVPPIEGADKQGVLTWRTLEDTLEMEKAAISCHNVVVIGGGLLGLEAARGLKAYCAKVTVVEFFPRLMPRQLDREGAQLLQDHVEELGINVIVGARTQEIEGADRATGVRLQRGDVLPAQTVVCATGVRPNDKVAEAAGIDVSRGVVVDDHMQTSDPDISAAGDIAVYKGYSWAIAPIAQAQARIAAANMAGEEKIYDVVVPSTTLKVVGIDVSSIGMVNPEGGDDEHIEVRHLDEEGVRYTKIVLRDGVIVGAIIINNRQLASALENKISNQETMTQAEAESLLTQ